MNRSDDSVEAYNAGGQLQSITTRAGRQYTLSYNALGQPSEVSGPFGRTLQFAYDANGHLETLTTPDGDYNYHYGPKGNLASVSYPDGTSREYIYDYIPYPHALTGIIDENGDRFATWRYDGHGRATSSEHGSGADRVTLTYNTDGTTTVTDALGAARNYTFATQHGVFKVDSVSGDRCTSCGGSSQATTYDANGYIASRTDWNGNVTTYVNNARGLEESRIEAAGTPQQRTITTQWHATFRLPTLITEPGKTIALDYDPVSGNLLSRTETDTVTGAQRITTFTYTPERLIDTVDGPRTDVNDITDYDYDAAGNRIRITNALGHITRITAHDGSGRPLTIVDPNDVTITLTYDARGRLRTRTIAGAQTTFDYDNVGQLTRITLPNAAFLDYDYDAAHRLTSVADNLGNRIEYGLDAMGNRTAEQVYDPNSVLTRTQTRVYDQLSRLREVVGADNQTTTYEYDGNGNQKLITDPLNRETRSDYDPLDRLIATTDPLQGQTGYGYDNQDNLATVTDPRGLTTTYTYNGFGDLTTQASPDTGATTYTYDAAGNRASQTDARGIAAHYTYDALNRLTHIQYPDSSRNVTYAYDNSGASNGTGRLTGMSDASGSTAYGYDGRNLVAESRVIQGATYLTQYGYDGADNLIQITYPSGRIVDYTRDAAGRVSTVTTTDNGSTDTVARDIRYLPFGPMQSAILGNGVPVTHTYDLDYRQTHIDSGSVQSLGYTYDDAHNITDITNNLDSSRNQTFGYDDLDRLTSASGIYGTVAYDYDAVGNRASRTADGNADTYAYDSFSNRLLSITGPNADVLGYDNAGNVTQTNGVTYSYDDTNRVIQANVSGSETGYTYNGKGERVVKSTPAQTTVFHYDLEGNLIAETTVTGQTQREYIYLDGRRLAVSEPASGQQQAGAPSDYAGVILSDNPMGYWRLGEQSGTTAFDQGAIANDGTFTGGITIGEASLLGDVGNTATRFDGSTGRVDEIGATADYSFVQNTGIFTLEAWIRLDDHTAAINGQTIMASAVSTSKKGFMLLYDNSAVVGSGVLRLLLLNGSRTAIVDARAHNAIKDNDAHHVVVTGDGTNINFYVDGVKQTAPETIGALSAGDASFRLSIGSGYNRRHIHLFDGVIDEVAIYSATLSDAQVVTHYNVGIGVGTDASVYYIHNDHLGTPQVITGHLRQVVWQADQTPFGQTTVTTNTLGNNLRFPGQYFDSETGLHYNYFRDYNPATGRYIQSDPIGLAGGLNTYAYASANPLAYYDPYGLFEWSLPQVVVDFSAGLGDVLLLGQGQRLRNWTGVDGGVDRCTGAYNYGTWAGIAGSFATGAVGGIRAAGARGAGMEFSHWIPARIGGPRTIANGNYVTTATHALSDPFRYRFMSRAWKASNPMPNRLNQQWVRLPDVYKGAAAGGSYGTAGAALSDCECRQ
ncbi:MAG: RHS repeat-associated core domain-containing protein [Gammaproteobacteria bacterium]